MAYPRSGGFKEPLMPEISLTNFVPNCCRVQCFFRFQKILYLIQGHIFHFKAQIVPYFSQIFKKGFVRSYFILSLHILKFPALPRDCIACYSTLPNNNDIVQHTFLSGLIRTDGEITFIQLRDAIARERGYAVFIVSLNSSFHCFVNKTSNKFAISHYQISKRCLNRIKNHPGSTRILSRGNFILK